MDALDRSQLGHPPSPPPAFETAMPLAPTMPFVFASPHSGSHYPPAFVAQSRLDADNLRRSEDSYVDLIYGDAPALGAPLIKAVYARAYIDLNREPWELDPGMFDGALPEYVNAGSPRVREGLGTIARVVAAGTEIYDRKLTISDAEARISGIYRPYHRALAALVSGTRARFGCAVLVECHSMPSRAAKAVKRAWRPRAGRPPADIVLGDRFGESCDRQITDAADRYFTGIGYRVARNDPYAGGYCTARHGRPGRGLHALQIEIRRGLYMDERSRAAHAGLDRLRRDVGGLIRTFADIDPAGLVAGPR